MNRKPNSVLVSFWKALKPEQQLMEEGIKLVLGMKNRVSPSTTYDVNDTGNKDCPPRSGHFQQPGEADGNARATV